MPLMETRETAVEGAPRKSLKCMVKEAAADTLGERWKGLWFRSVGGMPS